MGWENVIIHKFYLVPCGAAVTELEKPELTKKKHVLQTHRGSDGTLRISKGNTDLWPSLKTSCSHEGRSPYRGQVLLNVGEDRHPQGPGAGTMPRASQLPRASDQHKCHPTRTYPPPLPANICPTIFTEKLHTSFL